MLFVCDLSEMVLVVNVVNESLEVEIPRTMSVPVDVIVYEASVADAVGLELVHLPSSYVCVDDQLGVDPACVDCGDDAAG